MSFKEYIGVDMSMEIKTNLLKVLKSISKDLDEDSIDKSLGICILVHKKLRAITPRGSYLTTVEVTDAILRNLFNKFPDFSGDPVYPVRAREGIHPEKAYEKVYDNMWNKRTVYGRNRIKLLGFLISEIEEDLNNTPKI